MAWNHYPSWEKEENGTRAAQQWQCPKAFLLIHPELLQGKNRVGTQWPLTGYRVAFLGLYTSWHGSWNKGFFSSLPCLFLHQQPNCPCGEKCWRQKVRLSMWQLFSLFSNRSLHQNMHKKKKSHQMQYHIYTVAQRAEKWICWTRTCLFIFHIMCSKHLMLTSKLMFFYGTVKIALSLGMCHGVFLLIALTILHSEWAM